MGRQIIKQPNGKYAVWSSTVDNFILLDATPDEIIEGLVADSRRDIERAVHGKVESLDRGEKAYHQFTLSWDDALKQIAQEDPGDAQAYRRIGEKAD